MMAGQRAEGGVPAVGAGLAVDAAAEGFVYAAVDAAATRAHLADQLFFAVAGQVDWAALASRAVRAAYDATAFPVPEPAACAGACAAGRDRPRPRVPLGDAAAVPGRAGGR